MLGRTMHGIDYDEIHDEIVVPQQLGQAIMIFKGTARGEEPPVRVIQGSRTMITPDVMNRPLSPGAWCMTGSSVPRSMSAGPVMRRVCDRPESTSSGAIGESSPVSWLPGPRCGPSRTPLRRWPGRTADSRSPGCRGR